jgi:hypothetical protein
MAEGASTALSGIVGGLPRGILEERAQSSEMFPIQMLLLPAERREGGRRGVVMPGLVALLGVSRAPPPPVIILPDGELCFRNRTGYLEGSPTLAWGERIA